VHVVGLARGDAKAGDIDEQLLGGRAKRGRRFAGAVDSAGELFGNG